MAAPDSDSAVDRGGDEPGFVRASSLYDVATQTRTFDGWSGDAAAGEADRDE